MTQKFKFKTDKYRNSRGGSSKFLNIYCEHCGTHILLYQKDGPGPLKRMYLDRIVAPQRLTDLQSANIVPNLLCRGCKRLIAIPSIYEKEKRRAYALLAYTIIKKSGAGLYPPKVTKLNPEK